MKLSDGVSDMTPEEKFRKGTVVYKDEDGNYTLELWGASTKHPDSSFSMKDYVFPFWADRNNQEDVDSLVFQWLLECASKMTFPYHAEQLARYALENWR